MAVLCGLFAAACIVVLPACTSYQLSDRSINFNQALQDLDNRQVLLNAVRASKRYPPYFTSVNQINATGELDGSQLNLTVPFGPVGHNAFSAAPMIKASTGLTVSTNPLDTQDFYEGYMTPVKTSLIGYYLDFGWPPQLIYHTFLREVDLPKDLLQGIKLFAFNKVKKINKKCVDTFVSGTKNNPTSCLDNLSDIKLILDVMARNSSANSSTQVYCPDLDYVNNSSNLDRAQLPDLVKEGHDLVRFINDPNDDCHFATFQLLTAMLEKLRLAVVPVPSQTAAAPKPITIPTSDKGVSIKVQNDATSSSDNSKVTFALYDVPDPCATTKTPPAPRKTPPPAPAAHAAPAAQPAIVQPQPATPAQAVQQAHPLTLQTSDNPKAPTPAALVIKGAHVTPMPAWQATLCDDEKNWVKVVPRSPEAIVFYLGQLISAEHPDDDGTPFIANVQETHSPLPLFKVERGPATGAGAAEVSVELDGETYYIPRDKEHRSTMHMLTLTEQIIALQKKGTQLPTIPTVQVLGQ